MELPKSVKIGGVTYKITTAKPMKNHEGHKLMGKASFHKQEIRINPKYRCNLPRTLMHEIVHTIFENAGQDEHQSDEGLITCLQHGLVDFMRDNPDVVKFLQKEREWKSK